jgi:hypothetical protein
MPSPPEHRLQRGITDPVLLLISRREVEAADIDSVVSRLRVFSATREDALRYRSQMALVVTGYDEDPRELVDIAEVRAMLTRLTARWPYWAFFFNRVDGTLPLLFSCVAGIRFPGGGAVELDAHRVQHLLAQGLAGLDDLGHRFGLPDRDRQAMADSLVDVLSEAGIT